MKNIELFRLMLNNCNDIIDLKNQLEKIDIPESKRELRMTKVQQILSSNAAEEYLQKEVKTLLESLSQVAKGIDKEYLKYLKDTDNTIISLLSRVIDYNSNKGIANDYFVFAECVPSVKRFLESRIYEYEYFNKEN